MQFAEIFDAFGIEGFLDSVETFKNGNINKTYKAKTIKDGEVKEYILQRVNTYVFKKPEEIMHNIFNITDHLRKKIMERGVDPSRFVLNFHKTNKGYFLHNDSNNYVWRCYDFIGKSVTFNECNDLEILRSVGKAFGYFQVYLSDFDASSLFITIQDFHNTRKRLENFAAAAAEDSLGRAAECREEIEFLLENTAEASKLNELYDKGKLPLRVTHNDTKSNNVLFDEFSNKPLAVIDLDTVMPGFVAHDFGDAVRFAANTAREDEPDTSLIGLDLNKFRAFTDGFVGKISDRITNNEIKTMALGAFTITIELASRFLLDYLTGDLYFEPKYPKHNLIRAKSQIALAKDMIRKMSDMEKIVEVYLK